jgi:hypothetical protein
MNVKPTPSCLAKGGVRPNSLFLSSYLSVSSLFFCIRHICLCLSFTCLFMSLFLSTYLCLCFSFSVFVASTTNVSLSLHQSLLCLCLYFSVFVAATNASFSTSLCRSIFLSLHFLSFNLSLFIYFSHFLPVFIICAFIFFYLCDI